MCEKSWSARRPSEPCERQLPSGFPGPLAASTLGALLCLFAVAAIRLPSTLLEDLPTCLLISSAMLFEGREALFEEEPTRGDGEGPI